MLRLIPAVLDSFPLLLLDLDLTVHSVEAHPYRVLLGSTHGPQRAINPSLSRIVLNQNDTSAHLEIEMYRGRESVLLQIEVPVQSSSV